MSYFNPPIWTQPPTLEIISHKFLMPKMRNKSIMLTTMFWACCVSCFKNGGAQRPKWTFLDVQKNVQKNVQKSPP
jgi:hypothetical protein